MGISHNERWSAYTMNPYLRYITERRQIKSKIKRFIHEIKFKKYKNKLRNSKPTFADLWYVADLVKAAEFAFFYDNNPNTPGIYSSAMYKNNENGFKINCEQGTLVCKLYANIERVAIEVERRNGSNTKSHIEFDSLNLNNDQEKELNEILLDTVIEIIWDEIIKVINWCYYFDIHNTYATAI